jgi:hypothetical protein
MNPKPFWLLNHFTVPVVMGSSFEIDKRLTALKSAFGVVEIWREGRQSGALESGEAKSFGRNSMDTT